MFIKSTAVREGVTQAWLVTFLLASATIVLPSPAVSQTLPESASPLLDDPSGDVEAAVGPAIVPAQSSDALDLRSLAVDETPLELVFTLSVTSLAPAAVGTNRDSFAWSVTFTLLGQAHEVRFVRAYPAPGSPAVESAALYVGENPPVFLAATFDLASHTLHATIPRYLLKQPDGRAIEREAALIDITVSSRTSAQNLFPPMARPAIGDRMPDAGTAQLEFVYGSLPGEATALRASQPFRLSNGEATTYLFDVNFSTTMPGRYQFSLSGVPPTWKVEIPIAAASVESGLRLPVIVTVPFMHQHGTWRLFELVADGEGETAREQLGVVYTTVPQPAGHHRALFFHADGNPDYERRASMNTLEEDKTDSRLPVPASRFRCDGGRMIFEWDIPLRPVLGMGLQPSQRPGAVSLSLISPIDLEQASVQGRLMVGTNATRPVANWTADLGTVSAQEVMPIEAVVSSAWLDAISYSDGSNLVAVVALTAVNGGICLATGQASAFTQGYVAWQGARLLAGGRIDAPLDEFHQAVDLAFAGTTLEIQPVQSTTVLVNSGQELMLRAAVHALEDVDVRLTARAEGLAQADLAASSSLGLRRGETRDVLIGVSINDDARTGDRVQVIVVGQVNGNPVPAIAQFNLEIDDRATYASPEGLPAPDRAVPGLPIIPMLIAFALAIFGRRMFA